MNEAGSDRFQGYSGLLAKSARIRFQEHEEGAVMMDTVGGLMYVCNRTAALIWKCIVVDGCCRSRTAQILAERYRITLDAALSDIDLFEVSLHAIFV